MLKNLACTTKGYSELLPEKNRGGFGGGTNGTVAKFIFGGLENRTTTIGTESGVVLKAGDNSFGLKNDILAKVSSELATELAGQLSPG